MTKPSTTRSSSICRVTNSLIPFVCATISPKPTVAKTVTVKYSAVVWSNGEVNAAGSVSEFDK